jgi:hypothetical protein
VIKWPADRVEATVDLLRVPANALVLTAVEHHDAWPPECQLAVMDKALPPVRPVREAEQAGSSHARHWTLRVHISPHTYALT